MKKLLFFILLPFLSFGQVQIGDDIDGEAAGDFSGTSISLSSNGNIIAIGASQNNGNGPDSGHLRVYENQGGSWIQIGQDIDGENVENFLGISNGLSSDGTVVAIGASEANGNSSDSGHVRVFENQGGSWIQIGQDIDGENFNDGFGRSLALTSDGSTVVVGANGHDANGSNSGRVEIYENQGGSWVQIGQSIDGEGIGDISGTSVGISSDGNIVAIGASQNSGNGIDSGHVRVYENQGGTWIQVGQDIDGESAGDFSGGSLDLSSDGNILAIGATNNDGNGSDSGHVRVYENQGGSWVQIGEDINGESTGDWSGSLVLSDNGDIVAIGAIFNDGNGNSSGHVRIYKYENNSWIQLGTDIDGEFAGDASGGSLDLSSDGSVLAIGSTINDNNGTGQAIGHVRVFDLSDLLSTQQPALTTFSLYPNPTKNNFRITLSDQDTLQKATIYNSLGQEVLNSNQRTIDVSSLSKGVYVVEVQTTTGKGSEKLIIQ